MNLSEIKKLIRIFENSGVAEIEVEQDGLRIQMKKGIAPERQIVHIQPESHLAPVASIAPEAGTAPAAPSDADKSSGEAGVAGHLIKAPMVGTFFRSPSPTSPPFVEEGDIVRVGQSLCVIEAMKLMNEIESEIDGRVVSIFAENGKPVEFGTPLFEIEPR